MPNTGLRRLPLPTRLLALTALTLTTALSACTRSSAPATTPTQTREAREQAYAANNVGVALLEQLNYADAVGAFRKALSIDSTLAIARVNLALALLYEQDLDGAAKEATAAAAAMPDAPQPSYVLGLVARAQNRNDEARGFFEKVRSRDAADVGTNVNLAQIALEDRRYEDAIATLRPVAAKEPYHVTAAYVLGLALTRAGQTDEGQQLLTRAQSLRGANYAVTFGTGYLEQGRYAEAVASTGIEADLVDATTTIAPLRAESISKGEPAVASAIGRRFAAADLTGPAVRTLVSALGGGHVLIDTDGQGQRVLVVVSASSQHAFKRSESGWSDVTAESGLAIVPADSYGIGAISADADNDGLADLFVLRYGRSSLYRNTGKGQFEDVTRASGIPAYPALPSTAAFVDIDHDGDVDLVIGGSADLAATRRQSGSDWKFPDEFAPAPMQVLQNDGKGHFTDITRTTHLESKAHVTALVPTDFDNHRDIDLLVVTSDAPPALYTNQRDGTFRNTSDAAGLTKSMQTIGDVTATAAGDVNKDEWPDFFFSHQQGAELALSDGFGHFTFAPVDPALANASAAQLVDVDNDGLLDVVALTPAGVAVSRNTGQTWTNITAQITGGAAADTAARALLIADLDKDGNLDLLTSGNGSASLLRNAGDARHHSLRIDLRGRVSNRSGVGSKVQIRAGSLSARAETSSAFPPAAPSDVVFGLGTRAGADVTRVIWPSGIVQAEVAPAAGASAGVLPSPFVVTELDRKPSSCPFLFVWNGERFEFVTDFLGGGEMGYWEAPRTWNHPDPVEFVRVTGDRLKTVDGRLRMRVTNELEEVLYLDRFELASVTHPADVEVYPNEGMTVQPKPYRLHAVRTPHMPASVHDDHGHDVSSRVAHRDRTYPDDFTLLPIRGFAAPHFLTIDIGATSTPQTLLLTGWTDYAFSSDNVAAHQSGLTASEPALEVRAADGRWRPLHAEIGIPVGRPQTIAVDLSGLLRPGEHELRLSTSMRIYWDEIRVGDTMPLDGISSAPLDLRSAALQTRGFSAEVRPDGQNPPGYDYARVSQDSPWKVFAGKYTREGDVRGLLTHTDDKFVIARTGDEVSLEFDAPASPVPAGYTRTYLLMGDGYSKEMDINSASPDTVEPLPFHGMSGYPYTAAEHYPDDAEHRAYRDEFNTRHVGRTLPQLHRMPVAPRETR